MANTFYQVVALKLAAIAACGFTAASETNPYVKLAVSHVTWGVMAVVDERSLRNLFDRFDDRDKDEEENDEEKEGDRRKGDKGQE